MVGLPAMWLGARGSAIGAQVGRLEITLRCRMIRQAARSTPRNGDLIVFHSMGIEVRPGLPFWADGSGCDYALGAMQMGATAEQAVAVAMIWDQCTGGQINVIRR